MVCLRDEGPISIAIKDNINNDVKKPLIIRLFPTKTIDSIFYEIGNEFSYAPEDIVLVLENPNRQPIVLNNYRNKTLEDLNVTYTTAGQNTILIQSPRPNMNCDMNIRVEDTNEDDLLLGASASPTAGDLPSTSSCGPPPLLMQDEEYPQYSLARRAVLVESDNYVGLVNQAMTCYLNSLLQALFMTPEFRNALYNWEFDGQNETRSIPFQLQKLFLNLQTSTKSAVETTDLTKSFGWQGSDAWQQHDIQELCRVMFDALEQKFKDTRQANLINDLYEGQMLDYVKCLECGTEKSREDTFLDIPLPVRPFGSSVAYNSVEEALRAFVQPETLDGINQYHCEKCNKKCDAQKGLKFTKFPYLLTLHLKRFDFDYNTLHRIKLNDKVVFSEKLNLNSFIPAKRAENEQMEDKDHIVKYDDCSTTDSGSALDDEGCQSNDILTSVNGQDENNCGDSDEGIDVSLGNHEGEPPGPYVYDLFSIMIHSGSATGGHYYAYIKDFEKQQWFCFNDQCVSRITEDNIRKTYGGDPMKTYYTSAYTSGTNAYMLMYRQIDKARNCRAMTVDDFPPHIKGLLSQMRLKEEQDRIIREKESDSIKITVHCRHPVDGKLMEATISVYSDTTLADAAQYAYRDPRFKLEGLVALEDCRIVRYNKLQDCIHFSFDSDVLSFCDTGTSRGLNYLDWMLEIKPPGSVWQSYKSGGINIKVYPINLELEDLDEPLLVRIDNNETIRELKYRLAPLVNVEVHDMRIVLEHNNDYKYFTLDEEVFSFDRKITEYKLYVAHGSIESHEECAKLKRTIDKFRNVILLNVLLPDTDAVTLEMLSIPSLDLNQNLDKLELNSSERGTSSPNLRVSPQPSNNSSTCFDAFGDQSNSEDSSLSDSDRTLVGDAPIQNVGDCLGLLSTSPSSPADHHMSSPVDAETETYNYEGPEQLVEEMHWDDNDIQENHKCSYFFKVLGFIQWDNVDVSTETNYSKCCKVLVDKRIILEKLKKELEPHIRVPVDYFKIFVESHHTEEEWTNLSESLKLPTDGMKLIVKLGRVLRKDEISCKVHLLRIQNKEPLKYLFEHIIAKGQTVGQVLKEIVVQAKKQHMLDLRYNKCRLREKSWKHIKKVYMEDEVFGENILHRSNTELILQELVHTEVVTPSSSCTVFIRRWRPSTLTLEPAFEIVLSTSTGDEFFKKLSKISDIPVENIEFALTKLDLPADVHILEIHKDSYDWRRTFPSSTDWYMHSSSGNVVFYRDSTEPLKELSPDEHKEINLRENRRVGKICGLKTYSPGRERALKIYLDPSPSKNQETCTD